MNKLSEEIQEMSRAEAEPAVPAQSHEVLPPVEEDSCAQPVGEQGPIAVNTGMSSLIRICAAFYLFYLAFGLGKGFLEKQAEVWTSEVWVCLLGCIAFTVAALIILVRGLKVYLKFNSQYKKK